MEDQLGKLIDILTEEIARERKELSKPDNRQIQVDIAIYITGLERARDIAVLIWQEY